MTDLPEVQREIPLHRAQLSFLESDAPFRCFVAGRGAGKTWVGAHDLLMRSREGGTYLAASPTAAMMGDTTFPVFMAMARDLGLWDPRAVRLSPYPTVTLTTGAVVRFRTAEDPEKLRGPNIRGAWLDEASLMLAEAYTIVIAALREGGRQGWLSCTMTPKGPGHWTYETFGTGRPDTALFHATTADNPFLPLAFQDTLAAQYGGLDSALSRQELLGEFVGDEAWQVIPTAWILAAQARWAPKPPLEMLLSCLGVDVAYGGADATVIVPRHGTWFGVPKKYAGESTDSGQKSAALVLREHDGAALIHVDCIGYGAACHEWLRERVGKLAVAVDVRNAPRPEILDRSRKYKLTNLRTAMWWLLREALDPESGDGLQLPPGRELLADLAAPRFEVRASGIAVEPKDKVKERLGRSPDVGDAVCLAHLRPQLRKFSFFA